MGLFTNKNNPCAICGGPTRRLFPTTVEDQPICGSCKDKIDLPDDNFYGMSLADVRQYIAFYDENKSLHNDFCTFVNGNRGKVFVLLILRNRELNCPCDLLCVPRPFNLLDQFADIFSSSQ